jgi:hypothetical protein
MNRLSGGADNLREMKLILVRLCSVSYPLSFCNCVSVYKSATDLVVTKIGNLVNVTLTKRIS